VLCIADLTGEDTAGVTGLLVFVVLSAKNLAVPVRAIAA
jgi:hypothetical protein